MAKLSGDVASSPTGPDGSTAARRAARPKADVSGPDFAPGEKAEASWECQCGAGALDGIIEQVIRSARSEDLPRLRDLERAAGAIFRDLGMDAIADDEPLSIGALAAFQSAGRAWVFVDDLDRPVAYLLVEAIDTAAHIEQVSVHPESARRGLGGMLIEAAAGWAKQRGLEALTLTTYRDVPWNRPYYERLGFRIVGEGEMTAGLRALRAREISRGLDRWPRVAMRRPVDAENHECRSTRSRSVTARIGRSR